MKTARRLLAILLALLMVFALVACGGNGGGSGNGDGAGAGAGGSSSGGGSGGSSSGGGAGGVSASKDWTPPERPVDEMSGKTYKIIQHKPISDPFGYSQDSQMGVMVAERVAQVQALYGDCVLEFVEIPYNDSFAPAIQSLQFSEHGGDMIFSYNNAQLRKTLGTGGETSYMQDMLAFDNIINFWDLQKWGNITARECMMAGGTFYGVTPALWVDCTPLPYYQIVYSRDLMEAFGVTDPQEYWERNEWDRDVMLDVITSCYDDSTGEAIWGMTATMSHMVTYTYLTAGQPFVVVEDIKEDGTVDWHRGLTTDDAVEALTWLKNALNANKKFFNNGRTDWTTWEAHLPFIEGKCAMAVTRPLNLFGEIVVECENFGLIPWGGADANTLCGYYENVYAVAIPVFAQKATESAFLMMDLYEGLDNIESLEDVVAYYRNNYFETDLDVTFLLRDGVDFDYSYWPNGVSAIPNDVYNGLLTTSSVSSLVNKYDSVGSAEFEEHVVPNKVKLEAYRQAGMLS